MWSCKACSETNEDSFDSCWQCGTGKDGSPAPKGFMGNSQAIRLPKALRFRAKTVQIEKTSRGLLILDPKAETQRLKALSSLYGSCPNFPEVEPLELPAS
jgi:virulence-associated protein VagC